MYIPPLSPPPKKKASTSQTRQKNRSPFVSCQKVSCKRTSGRRLGCHPCFQRCYFHGVLLCPSSACWNSWNMVGNTCFRVKRSDFQITIMLICFRFAAHGSEQFQERSYHMMPTDKQNITWPTENKVINSSVMHCKFNAKNQCSKKCNLGTYFYFHDSISIQTIFNVWKCIYTVTMNWTIYFHRKGLGAQQISAFKSKKKCSAYFLWECTLSPNKDGSGKWRQSLER